MIIYETWFFLLFWFYYFYFLFLSFTRTQTHVSTAHGPNQLSNSPELGIVYLFCISIIFVAFLLCGKLHADQSYDTWSMFCMPYMPSIRISTKTCLYFHYYTVCGKCRRFSESSTRCYCTFCSQYYLSLGSWRWKDSASLQVSLLEMQGYYSRGNTLWCTL